MKINNEFIQKNLKEILENLRPDLVFEMFSRYSHGGFGSYTGWDIKIEYEGELLGEFSKGKCINGTWFNDEQERRNMSELYEKLKKECKTKDFPLFLNKLLCQGKQKGGISWNEYDFLIDIHKDKTKDDKQ